MFPDLLLMLLTAHFLLTLIHLVLLLLFIGIIDQKTLILLPFLLHLQLLLPKANQIFIHPSILFKELIVLFLNHLQLTS